MSTHERVALNDAAALTEVDFVFFRRYEDGRSSQVAAYVVDNSNQRLSKEQLAKLHAHAWRQGVAPLLYVAWPSSVDILSCARGPDFWIDGKEEYSPAIPGDLLSISADVNEGLRRVSAHRLADGTIWEEPKNQPLLEYSKTAHQSLIQAVVETDAALEGEQNPDLRRLLLLFVLIKYLEDRGVFPSEGWFGTWHRGARSFVEVLQSANPDGVHNLLAFLNSKFNGEVFALDSISKLSRTRLRTFADLLEAKTLDSQRYLWEQFSFRHLPVEIISHLYQRFVQGGHGQVYTPPFLATLLLDQAMPYSKLSGRERILDPSCGSGVFLVGAFRRLINVWRSQNDWRRPSVEQLKDLLASCIFGIDLDAYSIDLTAFSLSLAICDALQPDIIWKELKFDRLRGVNLFEDDFFQHVLMAKDEIPTPLAEGFDVIVGNPPFESRLTVAGRDVDAGARIQDGERPQLPDKQAAYLFLEQAIKYLRQGACLCLIQPSSLFYNWNTRTFRKYILANCRTDTLLDFTSIRNLYGADAKTVAILCFANPPGSGHFISHLIFRRTVSVQNRICFELDHYDTHPVHQDLAENDPFVWRINLLGGGRLLSLSQRIREMRTLQQFVEGESWEYGEGFIAAKTGRRIAAPFLTGLPLLPTRALTSSGIDESKIGIVEETKFRSPYSADRYSSPLLLIKELDTLPIAFWSSGPLAYKHTIVGIHCHKQYSENLRRLYATLNTHRRFYSLCCKLNGTQGFVGKATAILKQDIDILPYPEKEEDLALSFWESILQDDALDCMADFIRLGQDSKLLSRSATIQQVRSHADLFVRMLGSVYKNLLAGEPQFLDGLICQPYYFGDSPEVSWLNEETESELSRLVYNEELFAPLRTVRVVRFYTKNVILIVKPDRLRYWIPSTAIRDADETLLDLHRQGY